MSVLAIVPSLAYGWAGEWDACRRCGRNDRPEIDEGLCVECAAARYGELGLAHVAPEWAKGDKAMAMERPRLMPLPDETPEVYDWHPLHPACRDCGTTTIPHSSRGLCRNCYPASMKVGYTGNAAPPLTMAERAQLRARGPRVDPTPAPKAPTSAPVQPVKEEVNGGAGLLGTPRSVDGGLRQAGAAPGDAVLVPVADTGGRHPAAATEVVAAPLLRPRHAERVTIYRFTCPNCDGKLSDTATGRSEFRTIGDGLTLTCTAPPDGTGCGARWSIGADSLPGEA